MKDIGVKIWTRRMRTTLRTVFSILARVVRNVGVEAARTERCVKLGAMEVG